MTIAALLFNYGTQSSFKVCWAEVYQCIALDQQGLLWLVSRFDDQGNVHDVCSLFL